MNFLNQQASDFREASTCELEQSEQMKKGLVLSPVKIVLYGSNGLEREGQAFLTDRPFPLQEAQDWRRDWGRQYRAPGSQS